MRSLLVKSKSLNVKVILAYKGHFCRWTSCQSSVRKELEKELNEIREAGTFKNERLIEGKQGVHVRVKGSDETFINFCANNYLGLSSNRDVIEAGKRALDSHGAGLSSVRFICGTQDIHRDLERKIAAFHNREEAILYAACFDANAGIFEVLLGAEDAVISDELNHASIIDGIRLCKAKRFRYRHMDMEHLETQLKQSQNCRRRLIVSDGVFSMDGDLAPLREICSLADKYNSLVFLDECHATGVLGETGRGTEQYLDVMGKVDIINSTLGKALGGAMGGYTTGPRPLIDLLRQRSRPYLFSNSLAPAVVGSSIKVLDMLSESGELTQSLLAKTKVFREGMARNGFNVIGDRAHPICPVILGQAKLASQFAEEMLKKGIFVVGFSYPVVPKGKARIRVQISAGHSDEDIHKAVEAFRVVGRSLGVL